MNGIITDWGILAINSLIFIFIYLIIRYRLRQFYLLHSSSHPFLKPAHHFTINKALIHLPLHTIVRALHKLFTDFLLHLFTLFLCIIFIIVVGAIHVHLLLAEDWRHVNQVELRVPQLHVHSHWLHAIIELHNLKCDILLLKLLNNFFEIWHVWRAFWMIIAVFIVIASMRWRIANKYCTFYRFFGPILLQAQLETALHILWPIRLPLHTYCNKWLQESLEWCDFRCELNFHEPSFVIIISVADNAYTYNRVTLFLVIVYQLIDNLINGFTRSLNPRSHWACRIEYNSQFENGVITCHVEARLPQRNEILGDLAL